MALEVQFIVIFRLADILESRIPLKYDKLIQFYTYWYLLVCNWTDLHFH